MLSKTLSFFIARTCNINFYYVGPFKEKTGKGVLNVRSIVDFGISKILNADRPKEQADPLEKLMKSSNAMQRSIIFDNFNNI